MRELRDALQTLALPAREQIRVTQPGEVTVELYEDFTTYSRAFLEIAGTEVTDAKRASLEAVRNALESIPNEDFGDYAEGFDTAYELLLSRSSWEEVRRKAREGLATFSWPEEAPPAYERVASNIFWKPRRE